MSELATMLAEARANGAKLGQLDDAVKPRDLGEAYAVAGELTKGRGTQLGWKIGATNAPGQQLLGLTEPFFGRIFADDCHESPAQLAGHSSPYEVEPEVGFVMQHTLAASDAPFTREQVIAAVGALMPLLEINRPDYEEPFEVGGLALVADNGVNAGAICGNTVPFVDAAQPREVMVELLVDGHPAGHGAATDVLGDPVNALLWLANALPRYGLQLGVGEFVASGAMTRNVVLQSGQVIAAQFGALGSLTAAVVA